MDSYERKNGEKLHNEVAIKNCKDEQNRDVIDSLRLGSFDKLGNYVIIPDIKRELVDMPKVKIKEENREKDKAYYFVSYIPVFEDINFKLVVSNEEAVLFLEEEVNREAGGYVEIFDEYLTSVPLSKNLSLEEVFKIFNVQDEGVEKEELKLLNYDFQNILARKVYLSFLKKELADNMIVDEHEAYNEMIEILKNSGEYGERVLEEFLFRLENRSEVLAIDDVEIYNRAINEILLSAIELATTREDRQNKEILEIYLNLINIRNKNIDKYLVNAIKNIDDTYVDNFVLKEVEDFLNGRENGESRLEFLERIKLRKKKKGNRAPLLLPILKDRNVLDLTLKIDDNKEIEKKDAILQIISKEKEEVTKKVNSEKKEEKASPKPNKKPLKRVVPNKKVVKKKSGGKVAKKGGAKPKVKAKSAKKVNKPKIATKANVKKLTAKKAANKEVKKTATKPQKKAGKPEAKKSLPKSTYKAKDYSVSKNDIKDVEVFVRSGINKRKEEKQVVKPINIKIEPSKEEKKKENNDFKNNLMEELKNKNNARKKVSIKPKVEKVKKEAKKEEKKEEKSQKIGKENSANKDLNDAKETSDSFGL